MNTSRGNTTAILITKSETGSNDLFTINLNWVSHKCLMMTINNMQKAENGWKKY